jgi:hypothetical protein
VTGVLGTPFGARTALLVGVLAGSAVLAVMAPTPGVLRAVAVFAFALVGPGAAIAGLLGIRAAAPWAMVSLTGSLAVGVLTTELAALAGWWQPRVLLAALAAASTALGMLAWRLDNGPHAEAEVIA